MSTSGPSYAASPAERADVRLKMGIVFAISAVSILADSIPALCLPALGGLAFLLSCRPRASRVWPVLATLLAVTWGMVLSQGIFYNRFPRRALVVLLAPNAVFRDGLAIYAEGMLHGLVQSLRFIAVGLAGYAVCLSTAPDGFLRGMRALRVPQALAFMAVTAIRFIPVVVNEYRTVRAAMRLKGYRPLRLGVLHTVRRELGALRPVLAGTIRRSEEVAVSIIARGYNPHGDAFRQPEPPMRSSQRVLAGGIAGLVLAILILKALYLLYAWGLFYSPTLLPVYTFVRRNL